MKTCLFCRNTQVFNIHNYCSNRKYTVKDDMFQFFGHQIEDCLRQDDSLCNTCIIIITSTANLKRRLLPFIFRTEISCMDHYKPHSFGKKWSTLMQTDLDEDDDSMNPGSRSPTPNLYQCKQAAPYEPHFEMKYEKMEHQRSQSHVSSAKSDVNSEIIRTLSQKRRRKRGHGWSRTKKGRYSRIAIDTCQSRTASRPHSVMSVESYETFYPPCLDAPTHITNNNVKQNKAKQVEKRVEYFHDELYECSEEGCTFICEDLDSLTTHKMERHQQLTLFFCTLCRKKYSSQNDLTMHERSHSEQYSCIICHKEFYFENDLLKHWQQHVKKSVPCKYCKKRFLDQKVCNRHQINAHRRSIPSRIDYEKDVGTNHISNDYEEDVETNNTTNKEFEVRFLVQEINALDDSLKHPSHKL